MGLRRPLRTAGAALRAVLAPAVAAALAVLTPAVTLLAALTPAAASSRPVVLVLYDTGSPWGYVGEEYAILLTNLLGHFDVDVIRKPVTAYLPKEASASRAVLYLGAIYDEPLFHPSPTARAAWDAFLEDVADPARRTPVLWMGYNLWWLSWTWQGFAQRFGFLFEQLDSEGAYDRVLYKGVELLKGVVLRPAPGADLTGCIPEPDGSQACSPLLGRITVQDPALARVLAEARSTLTGARAPYVVEGGGLWYVGDVPLSHLSEEDRYLVVADLLHDVLGMDHRAERRALVRPEDVSAATPIQDLDAATGLLRRLNVPFGVAVIPVFVGPREGAPQTDTRKRPAPPGIHPISGSVVGDQLAKLQRRGEASVVQHGTTHQWDGGPNPFSGISGEDFEFYRVTEEEDHSLTFVGPLPEDSAAWARSRIDWGAEELRRAKLTPIGWEAPHYLASETDYRAVAERYRWHWGRVVYFAPSAPGGRFVGQLFPYPVRDVYGQWVLPESLGNIEPQGWNGYPSWLPEDLIRRARAVSVVRDGYASFFFHPSYDPALLEATLTGIRRLGYTFVRPCQLTRAC